MNKNNVRKWFGAALAASTLTIALAQAQDTVDISIVGFNDFHGNLLPTNFRVPDPADASKTLTVQAGGIESIGTLVKDLRKQNPNTLIVSGGDLTGASPLISSLLADEPTIAAANELKLSAAVVGNHEFDQGLQELMRLQKGGCGGPLADKACKFENNFKGANYPYIAANVIDKASGKSVLPPYVIENVGGVKVAFVGAVLKETPSIVSQSGVKGLEFTDEAKAINAVIPEIRQRGAETIVALVHQGGTAKDDFSKVDCNTLEGPIVDIVKGLDKAVDVVMTGHTHRGYQCLVDGRLVTQGDSYGHLLTKIDLKVDKKTGDVVNVKSNNIVVDAAKTAKDPAMTAILTKAKTLTDAIANQPIAKIGVEQITRDAAPSGESALGNLIADAQLHATKDPTKGGAQIALMNSGGVRANLPANVPNPNKVVTFGDTFAVQPFGNSLVVMTLTGAQLKETLEQQWKDPARTRINSVSQGFTYSYDDSKPYGEKVSGLQLNGQPIDLNGKYRVVVNSFMAEGGDNYVALRGGTERTGGDLDLDALQNYLREMERAGTPVTPPATNRITKLN